MKPLDDAIDEVFLPALFDAQISENERKILSLPVKHGGLGLRIVSSEADKSFEASVKFTQPLTEQIHNQSDDLPNPTEVKKAKDAAIGDVKRQATEQRDIITQGQTPTLKRTLEQLSEPGASSWLSVLPIKDKGFNLTKGEFNDALALRYNRTVKNLPEKCPCDARFTTTHALNCHLGGFVNARHDNIRDTVANLLKQVVHDVEIEPKLQPVVNKHGYMKTAILDDEARLDCRARGYWREGQNNFVDVCVTNADCASQENSSVKSVLRKHEQKKKRNYNRRVMEVEHGTFTPLIFTTTGVMGHECSVFHKTLAEKLSTKKNEKYEDVVRYLRVKYSYLALKATLLCLRGSRSVSKKRWGLSVEDFSMALNDLGL